jgi:hypothetical protein
MTITNGYATLEDFLLFVAPDAERDEMDDALIESLITAASRYIDNVTRRRFYASTETHYFDTPESGRDLWLNDDLLAVTTLTNGDGTVIPAAEYKLHPYNITPYYMLTLKASSDVYWQGEADGDTEGVISIAGSWGYSATAPEDIKEACLMIARNVYRGRTGETAGSATVTGAGVVITPKDVPQLAAAIIERYKGLA